MPGTGNPLKELKELTQKLHEPHEESPGLRSYFSKQVKSEKETYPSYGFGSSTRDGHTKVREYIKHLSCHALYDMHVYIITDALPINA